MLDYVNNYVQFELPQDSTPSVLRDHFQSDSLELFSQTSTNKTSRSQLRMFPINPEPSDSQTPTTIAFRVV